MAITNFIPSLWESQILRSNEDNLIARRICRARHSGEIKKYGDTVHFNGLVDPVIRPYGAGDITYDEMSDTRVTLQINQANYFAHTIDDIAAYQSNAELLGQQARRAAYCLQEAADRYVLNIAQAGAASGNVISNSAVTSANILSIIADAQCCLFENKVKERDMWIVVSPAIRNKLRLAGVKFSISGGVYGTGSLAWTDELGMDLYVSNNLAVDGDTVLAVAGSYNAVIYAEQIMNTEEIRLEKRIASAIRGLHVFGAKVLRPSELVRLELKPAAEGAI